MELTDSQRETVRELQQELKVLDLRADIEWAKYVHTKDEDCYNEVLALETEREMKGLIAYIPKGGEQRISKIRSLVSRLKGQQNQPCEGCDLGEYEYRLSALDSVNEWRASYELPPLGRLPKGVPGDPQDCTLAVAFRVSMEELGVKPTDITVSDGETIQLEGTYADGTYFESNPHLGEDATSLISRFDENAWLDLLRDDTLMYHAEEFAAAICEPEELARLQQMSDELAYRGLTHRVSVIDMLVDLGLGQPPVADQIPAGSFE